MVINHGNGYETTYSHLGKIYAKKGEFVKRGDIIAQSGNTGLSLRPTCITKSSTTVCG